MTDAGDIGWVKLHRRIKNWQWIGDPNVVAVMVQIMIRVNKEPKRWQGIDIPAGSFLTSREKLAAYSGLTEKQVRRALEVLNRADTITTTRAGTGQLVSLRNWAEYQDTPSDEGRQRADRRAGRGPDEGRTRAGTKEEEKERSTEAKKQDVVGERLAAFRTQCLEVHRSKKILSNEEAGRFFRYWTERSPSGKKHKWEFQKTFDIAGRMVTWRDNPINQKTNGRTAAKPGFNEYAQQVAAAVGRSVGATAAPDPGANGAASGALIPAGASTGGDGVPNDPAGNGLFDHADG